MLTYELPHSSAQVDLNHSTAMLKCMEQYMALGLAANQVGYPFRIITVAPNIVMIDPSITKLEGERYSQEEGCLSMPGVTYDVVRWHTVTVLYRDMFYILRENTFAGTTARVIQHEIDHLNGILMSERAEDTI